MYRVIITPAHVTLEADTEADVAVLIELYAAMKKLGVLPEQTTPVQTSRTRGGPKTRSTASAAAAERPRRKKQQSRFSENTDALYEALRQIGRPAFAREISDRATADGTFVTTAQDPANAARKLMIVDPRFTHKGSRWSLTDGFGHNEAVGLEEQANQQPIFSMSGGMPDEG